MARFFVGQRVRVVFGGHEWADILGEETRISRIDSGFYVLAIKPKADGREYGVLREDASDCLEPITPPHIPGSWEVIEQLLPNIREGVAA